jgi:hypothetical protein
MPAHICALMPVTLLGSPKGARAAVTKVERAADGIAPHPARTDVIPNSSMWARRGPLLDSLPPAPR